MTSSEMVSPFLVTGWADFYSTKPSGWERLGRDQRTISYGKYYLKIEKLQKMTTSWRCRKGLAPSLNHSFSQNVFIFFFGVTLPLSGKMAVKQFNLNGLNCTICSLTSLATLLPKKDKYVCQHSLTCCETASRTVELSCKIWRAHFPWISTIWSGSRSS